jgi:hypothetical protein
MNFEGCFKFLSGASAMKSSRPRRAIARGCSGKSPARPSASFISRHTTRPYGASEFCCGLLPLGEDALCPPPSMNCHHKRLFDPLEALAHDVHRILLI